MTTPEPTSITSSPGRIILTVLALFFLGSAIGGGLIQLMCEWQGISITDALNDFGPGSTAPERSFVKGLLIVNHLTTFLIPCLIAATIFYEKGWPISLSLTQWPNGKRIGLAIALLVCAFPIAQGLFEFNSWVLSQFEVSDKLTELESASEKLQLGLLKMDSFWELLTSVLAMAIVPAIGEELLFRGFVQKQLIRSFDKPIAGILLAALFFSIVHFQAQRFLAIFWLGTVLGLLYYWTKNLWVPIIAHFLNNGIQVLAAWFFQDDLETLNSQTDSFPWYIILVGLVLFPFFAKLLSSTKNETPHP